MQTTSPPPSSPAAVAATKESKYPSYYPRHYTFPPFYTRQPNENTWSSQLDEWRDFILEYCRHHKLWRLNLVDALETDLFRNKELNRKLYISTVREIIQSLISTKNAEWVGTEKSLVLIYWRTPEDWASLIAKWIDDTGQKNTVLTLFELTEGDQTTKQEFYGMDTAILNRSLDVLVKAGTAQVFSVGDESGVKFY